LSRRSDKTVTRSFRVSESALRAIEDEARRHNLSTNSFVNQLLLSYANYDRFMEKVHMIKMTTPGLRTLMEAGTDEKLAEAGRIAGRSIGKSFIMARKGALSVENSIEQLRAMGDYANYWEFNEVDRDGRRIITLIHDLGPKGSLFLSGVGEALFESAGARPKCTTTDDSVIYEL
jgi:hypothetical protein